MNNEMPHSMMDVLRMIADERAAQKKKEDEQQRKALEAGIGADNWNMINMFKRAFDDMAGSLAFHMAAAMQVGDTQAARLGLMECEYLSRKARYMWDTLELVGIPPQEFGIQSNPASFFQRMAGAKQICQRVLDGEDLRNMTLATVLDTTA
jgi:hypothetical protein